MFTDIKCGKCSIVFPMKISDYLERSSDRQNVHRTRIVCPSCWTEMPYELKRTFDEFVFSNGKIEGWEIGLRFQKSE